MIIQDTDGFSPQRQPAQEYTPQFAVCIHSNGHDVIATGHDVLRNGSLGAGKIISLDDLNRVVASHTGQQQTSIQWTNPSVLLDTDALLVWSIAPQKRTLWFRIDETQSVDVIIPRTIFVVSRKTRSMAVFAAPSKKPTPDTNLYHAPYMNVGNQGALCQGTAQIPADVSVTTDELLKGCEDALFDSLFTHKNHDGTWRTQKGKGISNPQHIARWKKVAKENRAPRMSELNSTGITLREYIDRITAKGSMH